MASLDFAAQVSSESDARLIERQSETQAHFEISVLASDGTRLAFRLIVEAFKDEYLHVRETTPSLLPSGCPQRHINYDGTFCLGWSVVEDLKVLSADDARRWWKMVYAFLIKQLRASRTKKWPGDEWAHGHAAAVSQCLTEMAAKSLGESFLENLKSHKLRVEVVDRESTDKSLLKVYQNGKHIYSVWKKSEKIINAQRTCPCKGHGKSKPKKIRNCKEHAADLATLGVHLHKKEIEERKFYEAYASQRKCCGSMTNCPIADMVGVE